MKAPRLAALTAGLALAVAAAADDTAKWGSLEEGVAAAKKSGKPVLVVTIWKPGGL